MIDLEDAQQIIPASRHAWVKLRLHSGHEIMDMNHIEYRGYSLDAVQHGPGWRVHISPGPRLLRTQPDHVAAATKEEAFAKARAIIDHHLLG